MVYLPTMKKIECVDGITYQFLTYRDKHVGLVNLWDRVEVWLEPIFDKKISRRDLNDGL